MLVGLLVKCDWCGLHRWMPRNRGGNSWHGMQNQPGNSAIEVDHFFLDLLATFRSDSLTWAPRENEGLLGWLATPPLISLFKYRFLGTVLFSCLWNFLGLSPLGLGTKRKSDQSLSICVKSTMSVWARWTLFTFRLVNWFINIAI